MTTRRIVAPPSQPDSQPDSARVMVADRKWRGARAGRPRGVSALRRGVDAVRSEVGPALVAVFSCKGGVGVSVMTTLLAGAAAQHPRGALVVDLTGDVAIAAGMSADSGPGVTEWLAVPEPPGPDALTRLEREISPGLWLVPRGSAPLHDGHIGALMDLLELDPRAVFIDCGRIEAGRRADPANSVESADGEGTGPPLSAAALIADRCRTRWLVTRNCYLSVQASTRRSVEPTGCIVVTEDSRALRPSDVEEALGLPIIVQLALDPIVARLVDAGLLLGRIPRDLERVLHQVLEEAQ